MFDSSSNNSDSPSMKQEEAVERTGVGMGAWDLGFYKISFVWGPFQHSLDLQHKTNITGQSRLVKRGNLDAAR